MMTLCHYYLYTYIVYHIEWSIAELFYILKINLSTMRVHVEIIQYNNRD